MKPRFRHAAVGFASLVSSLIACGSGESDPAPTDPTPAAPTSTTTPPTTPSCSGSACTPVVPGPEPVPPLRVRFLNVGGFLLERGNEAVVTVPLYTRPNMIEASLGTPITSDTALVESSFPAAALPNVRAILSGHAHYDHLLDAPALMGVTPNSTLYTNRSGRNLLAAFAPDRAPACAGSPAQPKTIARSRIVAVDDAAASTIDYSNCPEKKPAGAPLKGTWMKVPNAHVRVLAICSEHPAQIGPVHYGAGNVDDEQCTPQTNMNEWREGNTVALLVDFLDPTTEKPLYRVYYQDAPTETPQGIPTDFLAEKRVDLSLMCVGNYNVVDDGSPAKALTALTTRYALGGHWEDFFQKVGAAIVPLPFTDVDAWGTKARAALTGTELPMIHNHQPAQYRAALPQPGDTFEIPFLVPPPSKP